MIEMTGSWNTNTNTNTKITKNTKKKVVTDMGEGEHCKKYSRDLMNISAYFQTKRGLVFIQLSVTRDNSFFSE